MLARLDAALERQHAIQKKRQLAAYAALERRNQDPDKLYGSAVRAISKYKDSRQSRDYSRFRTWKRLLFERFPGRAARIIEQACEDAGWEADLSARFAKLS